MKQKRTKKGQKRTRFFCKYCDYTTSHIGRGKDILNEETQKVRNETK